VRVIAGQARGARLKSPRGVHIRPMMDRVRGALFNMIAAQGGPGERVLDLYAGTGAVGIEALSRGAVAADFVDNHPRCCRTIQENLIAAGMKGRGRVFRRRADRVLTRPALLALPSGGPADLRLGVGHAAVLPHRFRGGAPPSGQIGPCGGRSYRGRGTCSNI